MYRNIIVLLLDSNSTNKRSLKNNLIFIFKLTIIFQVYRNIIVKALIHLIHLYLIHHLHDFLQDGDARATFRLAGSFLLEILFLPKTEIVVILDR